VVEAEWEYAARAGNARSRYGKPDRIAWYDGNSGNWTHQAGRKQPNSWGLYDMLGNVWEWVADWYAPYTPDGVTDPQGPANGEFRVLRGGSWLNVTWSARASCRSSNAPANHWDHVGFRCAGD
jgi:formylglycine-generating enzyme required for sulfatase activity